MNHYLIKAALAATLWAAPLHAAPAGFTDFVGFGDSLSDKGRFPELLATNPPQDGSRFSDGPTWMERVGAAFEAMSGGNVNLALGGATAGPNTLNRVAQYTFAESVNGPRDANDPDDIPFLELIDFGAQINSFLNGPTTSAVGGLANSIGSNPLVTVLLGGNDFLGLPDNPTEADFLTVGSTIITALSTGISVLAAADAKFDDFMISNMPSFTKAPSIFFVPQVFKDPTDLAIQQFNMALAASMDSLGTTLGVNIQIFDLYSTFESRYQEGLLAGLIGSDSCLPGGGVNNCPNPGDSEAYLFLDDIHPNSFIHEGIADAALLRVESFAAPVPLPAGGVLLIGAVCMFAGMRRRAA
jgi:phospholipase/lecithinase/hemolysin